MNKGIKKKWVKALRSGNYEQGKELLRTLDNKYCCLGVLCDLYTQEDVGKSNNWKETANGFTINQESQVLPDPVREWSEIWHEDPILDTKTKGKSVITYLNDEVNYSFKQLANLIEEQL